VDIVREDDWEAFDPRYFIKHLPPLTKEQRCRQPGALPSTATSALFLIPFFDQGCKMLFAVMRTKYPRSSLIRMDASITD